MKFVSENTLWKWFSLYIRLRDANRNGYCRCISCGRIHYYKDMQAGHYYSRRIIYLAIKYDEKNVNAQCVYCNKFLAGNGAGYRNGLVNKYGEDVFDYLDSKKHNKVPNWGPVVITALSDEYRSKAQRMAKQKGIKI